MISGEVDARKQAVVEITLRCSDGDTIGIRAVVDTGYDGFLTISPETLSRLNAPFREARYYELGDGQITKFDLHNVDVKWDGETRTVPTIITIGGELVGMAMLAGHELFIDVVDGGSVRISRRA